MHNLPSRLFSLLVAIFVGVSAYGRSDASTLEWEIDSTQVGNLNLTLNSTLFFQNNEFSTPHMKGYTLPGFKLRPSLNYRPNKRVSLEMGMYMLNFWGTDAYPNLAYSDIAEWTGSENATKGFHMVPFFRVQMATKGGLNFVLGSIYGGRYHQLLEPLYAPELNLTADPEAGAQVLYNNKWLYLDTWINWESFIYKNDVHQEAFTFGVSSRLKYNRENSKIHVYTPVQALFQHRGGEIDTIYSNSVHTLFNGAIGLGADLNIGRKVLKSISLEADALAYNQQAGVLWPYDSGWAYYVHCKADIANVNVKAGYVYSSKFVSLFGYPFYGGISVSNEGMTFDDTSTFYAGLDYSHEFAPGYRLGANAMFYRHFPSTGIRDGVAENFGSSTSFYASIYFRLNPSFLLKKVK